ncbi:MAG: FAD:protein FMN transferase [Myxococcota bacterium]
MTPTWLIALSLLAAPAATPPVFDSADGCPGRVTVIETVMGTRGTISICPLDATEARAASARDAAQRGLREIARLEGLWSTWLRDSDISRLNRAAGGRAVLVAEETAAVLAQSLRASRETRGIFDVTFAPLAEIWRFDTPPGSHQPTRLAQVPSDADIAARLARIGYEGLEVDVAARTARLARPGMLVNLGGIGKGAAVDRVVAMLRGQGFGNFAVQLGGDLYCAGENGERPWQVGVAHPRLKGALLGVVAVRDAAFSTSGDYERFAVIGGRRYHHIMDLRTGWPATASQSATALARTAVDAEVLTKTAFIVGGAEGLALVEGAGARAVLVTAGGEVLWSQGLPRLAQ